MQNLLYYICPYINTKCVINLYNHNNNPRKWLFCMENKKLLNRWTISDLLQKSIKGIGEKPGKGFVFRPHSLRYGGATDLLKAGVPDSIIRKKTRHCPNSAMLHLYTSLEPIETQLLCMR